MLNIKQQIMKRWIMAIWVFSWAIAAAAQGPGFALEGIGSARVAVTWDKMTNIIFPQPVLTGVKVSRDVLAQKVKGVENVIELKAMQKGFPETNFSVYGRDGRLYSFVLRYCEDTTILNYRVVGGTGGATVVLSGLPANEVRLREDADSLAGDRFFLRRVCRRDRVRLRLGGVYLRDSLLWLCFSLTNSSRVAFGPVRWEFYIEDRKQIRRRAVQEVAVAPVVGASAASAVSVRRGTSVGSGASVGPGTSVGSASWACVAGRRMERLAVGFAPFSVPAGKRLVIRVTGQDGRELKLRLKGRVILRAHDGRRRSQVRIRITV